MRSLQRCGFLLLILLPAVCAQETKDASGLIRFSSKSSLVTVPVLVTRSDKPVTGLKKQDFTVLMDGKPQPISTFEEITTQVPRLTSKDAGVGKPGPAEFSNVGPAYPTRFTIVAIDMTSPLSPRGRDAMLKYLSQNITSQEPIALVTVTRVGIRVIHDFSTDPAVLVAALKSRRNLSDSLAVQPVDSVAKESAAIYDVFPPTTNFSAAGVGGGGTGKTLIEQLTSAVLNEMDREKFLFSSVDGVTALARGYGGIPGRKSLIWISAAPPFPPRALNAALNSNIQKAVLELKNANMALYPISLAGLIASFSRSSIVAGGEGTRGSKVAEDQSIVRRTAEMDVMLNRGGTAEEDMQWIAEATGGKAFVRTNDFSRAIARAMEDSAHYYQLTYYLPSDTRPGLHRINVKLAAPKAQVRARTTVLVADLAAHPDAQVDFKHALGSPFEQTGVPLAVQWAGQGGNEGGPKRAMFRLSILPNGAEVDDRDGNRVSVGVTVLVINPELIIVDKFSRTIEGRLTPERLQQFAKSGLNFDSSVELSPGSYSVKFLVRDNISGRVGTVTAPLSVE